MKRVLFVCTGNRARSQMAEGLLRHVAGDRFEACSAGTEPKEISPLTVEVMRELGIHVSGQRSEHVDEYASRALDYVITVCDRAREACPVFPGGRRIHWSVEDPAVTEERGAASVDAFREARDELRRRIEEFVGREGAGAD